MNSKHPLLMLSTALLAAMSSAGLTAPLPDGTLLTIDPGIKSSLYGPCVSGSCFDFDYTLFPAYPYSIAPGTDGGIIVGKNQKGGGQETSRTEVNTTSGEITAAWNMGSYYGTFATVPLSVGGPDASANLFSDTSCVGSACQGVTELKAWYAALGGPLGGYITLGSAQTCNWAECKGVTRWTVTPDGPPGLDGDRYVLEYEWPKVPWECYPTAGCINFWLRLEGTIWLPGSNSPPLAQPVTFLAPREITTSWTPVVSDRNNDPLTCRLGTPPQVGVANVATDCSSGTYQPNPGFIGIDSFTYIANDGQSDSDPATVTAAVYDGGGSTPCIRQYPVSQFSQTGKEGTLTITFTGNIVSYTNKAVKLCPGTALKYQAGSTKGPVVCKIKNNTTRGSGTLKINDHIKCTDKPAGKDKVGFKLKSGVR